MVSADCDPLNPKWVLKRHVAKSGESASLPVVKWHSYLEQMDRAQTGVLTSRVDTGSPADELGAANTECRTSAVRSVAAYVDAHLRTSRLACQERHHAVVSRWSCIRSAPLEMVVTVRGRPWNRLDIIRHGLCIVPCTLQGTMQDIHLLYFTLLYITLLYVAVCWPTTIISWQASFALFLQELCK